VATAIPWEKLMAAQKLRAKLPALVAVVSAAALVLLGAGQVQAAAHPDSVYGKFKVNYKESWTFKSSSIRRCITFTATGTYTYTIIFHTFPRGGWEYSWVDQVLHNPTLHASANVYSHRKCGRPAELATMTLDQEWAGYACSFNPSISVSLPWGVAISGWPSCGNRNQGGRLSGPYPKPEKAYTQNNSGTPLSFESYGQIDDLLKQYPCYGIYVATEAYTNSSSDTYSSGAKQICLSKH
jgi:hypothetical protein